MDTAASASKGLVFGLLVGFLLVAAAPPSVANVIYRYEGIPFDDITGTTYTTSDFVIIELEFTDLLLADSSPGDLTSAVLSWSFMDGQQAFLSSAPDQLNALVFLNSSFSTWTRIRSPHSGR